MSNITYIGDILRDNERLEKKEKELLEKIQELENEIIVLKNEAKTNQEMIEYLEDFYKNFIMNFDALINGEK